MKSDDILELKPDATDITNGAVEVKVLRVNGNNMVLETTSASGVRTQVNATVSQVETMFKVKRAASESR